MPVPFAVSEFETIASLRSYLKLVASHDLSRHTPRLASKKARVGCGIERELLQLGLREPGADVLIALIPVGLAGKIRKPPVVIRRIVEERVEPLESGIRAPGRAERILCRERRI